MVSYDPSLGTDRDWVRLLIGDRDIESAKLQDEEINALLREEPNKYLAAARAGELILGSRGGVTMKTVSDLSIMYGDSPTSSYRAHINVLRQRGIRLQMHPNYHLKVLSCG
jgi:hypothetical protein